MMLETALLIFALHFGQATQPEILVGPNAEFNLTCDPVTTDINGNPEEIAGYEFSVGPTTLDPDADPTGILATIPLAPEELAAGVNGIPLLITRNPGSYRIWARAIDRAGNWSIHSEPMNVRWDPIPPTKPTIKYKITIQIEMTNS